MRPRREELDPPPGRRMDRRAWEPTRLIERDASRKMGRAGREKKWQRAAELGRWRAGARAVPTKRKSEGEAKGGAAVGRRTRVKTAEERGGRRATASGEKE